MSCSASILVVCETNIPVYLWPDCHKEARHVARASWSATDRQSSNLGNLTFLQTNLGF